MTTTLSTIADEAERLPAVERIKLVERLLGSLDKSDPAIDKAWAEVGEARLDACRNGQVVAKPAAEVMAKYLKS